MRPLCGVRCVRRQVHPPRGDRCTRSHGGRCLTRAGGGDPGRGGTGGGERGRDRRSRLHRRAHKARPALPAPRQQPRLASAGEDEITRCSSFFLGTGVGSRNEPRHLKLFGGCIRERASPRAWSGRFPCPDWPQPGVFARPTWPLECGAHRKGLARARGRSGSVCSRRNLPRCLGCVEATSAGSQVASGSHRRGLVKAVGTAPPRPARAGCDGPQAPRRLGAGKRGSIRNMQCVGGGRLQKWPTGQTAD